MGKTSRKTTYTRYSSSSDDSDYSGSGFSSDYTDSSDDSEYEYRKSKKKGDNKRRKSQRHNSERANEKKQYHLAVIFAEFLTICAFLFLAWSVIFGDQQVFGKRLSGAAAQYLDSFMGNTDPYLYGGVCMIGVCVGLWAIFMIGMKMPTQKLHRMVLMGKAFSIVCTICLVAKEMIDTKDDGILEDAFESIVDRGFKNIHLTWLCLGLQIMTVFVLTTMVTMSEINEEERSGRRRRDYY